MYEKFGNIILFSKRKGLDDRLISYFTKSDYIHSGIKVRRNVAESLGRLGKRTHFLPTMFDWIELEHKEIKYEDRIQLKKLHENEPYIYDFIQIGLLTFRRYKLGIIDDMNLSVYGNQCSGRDAKMYNKLGLKVLDGVHFSQIVPSDYLRSKYFERIK